MSPDNCDIIVLACVVLHNFLMVNDHKRLYCPANYVDREGNDGVVHEGEWRSQLRADGCNPLRSYTTHIRRSTESAIELRNKLADYFINEGAVPFQNRMI